MKKYLLLVVFASLFYSILAQDYYKSDDLYLQVINRLVEKNEKFSDTIFILKKEFLPEEPPFEIYGHKVIYIEGKEMYDKVCFEIYSISITNDTLVILVSEYVNEKPQPMLEYVCSLRFEFIFNCNKKKFMFYKKSVLSF